MNELYEGSLQTQGIEVLMSIQNNEAQYQAKLDNLKTQIQTIEKAYRKRIDVIEANADRFDQSKVADQLHDARESTRNTLQELVNTKGWRKAIAETLKELESFDEGSELKQLQQTLLEIEARACIADGKIDPLVLQGYVQEGNPLWVSAVKNSPVPCEGITDEMLSVGDKARLEVLKPTVAAKYHSLLRVQSNLEGAADLFMHVEKGDIDPLADLATG